MARECLCIEENRKKTLREIERDIELSHVHSQHGWVFTSMPKVNPQVHNTSNLSIVLHASKFIVLLSLTVLLLLVWAILYKLIKLPFLILYCFVLFSFWLYLLLLTIKLNMGLLSLLWFKIWVFAKSNGGICSLTQTRLYEICSFKWKTENIVTYSLCVYFWILFQILDLGQNRNCTNAQFCAWICTGWKKKFKSLYNIYVCKYAYSVQLTQVLPIFVFVLACVSVMVFLFLFKIHVRWEFIA